MDTNACYAVFVPSLAGRSALLQLRSYQGKDADYPSVLLHAPVAAASLAELAGRTVEARMFIREDRDTVWDNVDAPPISLRIDSVTDKELKGTIVGGQLRNNATGSSHDVSGTLTAVLSQ